MADLPVVAVIATHGVERVSFLLNRALPSVSRQTRPVDLVIVVSDDDLLLQDDAVSIEECFLPDFRDRVRLLSNARTRKTSGTGSWNTGIMAAYAAFEDCWVAILDDDDEWKDDHVSTCLAATNKDCQWVVSGIIRQGQSGPTKEPILKNHPVANEFFTTNPGVQGSNIFVRVGLLLKAGLFDESLPSTTDRDLCIRLCDVLEGNCNTFASTGTYSVVHYADPGRQRVSSPGSTAKIQGLRRFYLKHGPRMKEEERHEFKTRAWVLFGCKCSEFDAVAEIDEPTYFEAWSGQQLPLCTGTAGLLPKIHSSVLPLTSLKRSGLFGITTSDPERIRPLLEDLTSISASPQADFIPFIVLFGNSYEISEFLKEELARKNLRGYILERSNKVVESILMRCHGVNLPCCSNRLPIALSRTVLQVFIFCIVDYLEDMNAVVILDDDKRLKKGWSPFAVSNDASNSKGDNIKIGRDLRTPPNPSIFSLRTNLIDLLYGLDLHYSTGKNKEDIERFCYYHEVLGEKHDWYYDLSSARYDHLEMPVYKRTDINITTSFFHKTRNALLVGSPLCRDVIPPSKSGTTEQRGGCMVILNNNDRSLLPLAVQQHAPLIKHHNGEVSHTRRSDSFWCQFQKKHGFNLLVQANLFVYHDNQQDHIPTPTDIRRTVVEEVLGGILCRKRKHRESYKRQRILELRSWFIRLRGILLTLRHRSYTSDEMITSLIAPIEDIFDSQCWEHEVFSVIEGEFASLKNFEPTPVDFSKVSLDQGSVENVMIRIDEVDKKKLVLEWNKVRIKAACDILYKSTGHIGEFVGIGKEGVSLCSKGFLYKVFDRVPELPREALHMLGVSFVESTGSTPISRRSLYSGKMYQGGHGTALLQMLRSLQTKNLYHTNISPENLLFDVENQALTVIDLGRDIVYQKSSLLYEEHFNDMCRRSFLCFRYGCCGSNGYMLKKLKIALRDPREHHLVGFENFMKVITNGSGYKPEHQLLNKLNKMNAVCCGIVAQSNCSDMPFPTILADNEDNVVIKKIESVITCQLNQLQLHSIALILEDPYSDASSMRRRPVWFYYRHLRRFLHSGAFSIEEESITMIQTDNFHECTKYLIIALVPRHPGCYLLIKTCPMEHSIILSNVRRLVHCLEKVMSLKAIMLVADISKTDKFIRQYETSNIESYKRALHQIQDERLIDHLVIFDGKDTTQIQELNKKWLGKNSDATHSLEGQQHASTFYALQAIKNHPSYSANDLVLQMDSDILLHCESFASGLTECASEFRKEPKLITFAFPIPDTRVSGCSRQYIRKDGKPPRMEIRCSFLHLARIFDILPLIIPPNEISSNKDFCLRRGWWHTFDYNIQTRGMKSCRGSLAGNHWFFLHPQNELKQSEIIQDLHLVSDLISSNSCLMSVIRNTTAWKNQIGKVDLQTTGGDWLHLRNEDIVVVFYLLNTSEIDAVRSFESFRKCRQEKPEFHNCGVVIVDNGSWNYEDISAKIFEWARNMFGTIHLTTFCLRNGLSVSSEKFKNCIQQICSNPSPKIFMVNTNEHFNLQQCMLPLQHCYECESMFEGHSCPCYREPHSEFINAPHTDLPIKVPAFGIKPSCFHSTTFYTTDWFVEGDLRIQLVACVKGNDSINGAEDVCVRLHSECLTGDVFYSQKCDCGDQKLKFMHQLEREKHAVLLYIKGHEGRGAGLHNKIKAYSLLDSHVSKTHVDALGDVGCQSDIREYDTAYLFLKNALHLKSIRLFSNNPQKIIAAKKAFGSNNVTVCSMPAVAGKYNERYLQEKVELFGHDGLLKK